jgi:formate dehydrogenase major subunit
MGGIQWPCPDENSDGELFLPGRLWERPVTTTRAPFFAVEYAAPVDELTDEFPTRLTTGRRLDSYNTGVQSGRYDSPRRIHGAIDLSPEDGAELGVGEGDRVRVVSRRGSLEAPVRFDDSLRPGLAFMSVHFPDQTDVNVLTLDAWDPKSGTAEFKATAIRIEALV